MNAQKIMDEIGVFLDRSLLKKSKITKAEIIRFIEAKWAEADDEKYEDFSFPLQLEYFGKALEQEGEFRCTFLDEDS